MGVVQFFDGKTIFITGATGFMGKVLVEKLLRSCPGIEKIYILIRPKKGCSSIEERLEKFKELNVFERIKKHNPDVLNKVIGIKGDVSELNLGLSDSDRKLLVDNVNIIYHSAASVRFDDFLEKAILLNVRGTREVAQLALDLKNPTIFVHISTAFSYINQFVLEERLYPPPTNWEDAILLAETCDKQLMHIMSEKYIHPYPNTYTFAKGLGEHVVNDMCKGKIRTIITRPSIVVSSIEEPMPGFIDNFNGPIGLYTAGAKGIISIGLARHDLDVNYIPVDVVIKGIVLASYNATKKTYSEENDVEVYNITEKIIDTTMEHFLHIATEVVKQYPMQNCLWYPKCGCTTSKLNFYINILLFHMFPAVLLDIMLRLTGNKPMVVKIIRKIYIAGCLLYHFTTESYSFINEKMLSMQRNLTEDEEAFRYSKTFSHDELITFISKGICGISLYTLNEAIDTPSQREIGKMRKLWYIDMITKILKYVFISWLLFLKLNILGRLWTYYIPN